ncbi:hypothetical protein B484DRAFT_449923 [Ochromonadaceae sp. CCMP2298]|nr:hypothetical protein B484DRAFT_449923 [Ochromonadaceae sp. CCMP2298]|mmetsp:Transcript_16609/g.36838  ORF Transcript_16609/g.36838 Transcript_16609/m.36838 type:complete len:187 (-) Transcript_16609:478-1038(-)|eukprot:CAMPEP_0173190830 /NCGR_PEP_ID=MMETSP1141-20130122/12556_1 /TAXON_ID=483371 /ORGANISM="non described non described, Strain CCMP2298" /LENGTH=186 /DNA_ID=CAMNT_0014114969 /DNA_START=112 /DNA_END=672 /DNA_ORIENTATION=-
MKLLALLLALLLQYTRINAREGDDKWKKLNLNALDKEYEQGDELAELETEWDRIEKVSKAKTPSYDVNDPESIKAAYKKAPALFSGGGGGSMIFVNIKTHERGRLRTLRDMNTLATRYSSLLRSGGLQADVYNTDDHVLMLNVAKGWLANDVMRFVAQQPEVEKFTVDQREYTPADFKQDEDDDDD